VGTTRNPVAPVTVPDRHRGVVLRRAQ
jgi:hypothetical protein